MRVVFAGTPEVAVPSLERLCETEVTVAAVITRLDAEVGRKRVMTPSPVAAFAEQLSLPVIKANRLDDDVTSHIASFKPDLGVIVAYGGLVREPLLSLPRLGWINLHFSLLPRWRGAAPVQRAIIAGDKTTGAAVFQLVRELDAGSIFDRVTRAIGPDETSGDVLAALASSGAELLARVVADIRDGRASSTAQSGEVTTAPKLTLDDAHIDFRTSAQAVYDRIRGVTPEPGPFALLDGHRVKIMRARIATDASSSPAATLAWDGKRLLVGTTTDPIHLLEVQPAGKRAMSAGDWWRGLANRDGVTAA
jgi:methionyl-tRNA formyltransferase